jgi:hypothetical protein
MNILYTKYKMSEHGIIELMNDILGSTHQIVSIGNSNVVLAKLPDEDLAPKNSVIHSSHDESNPVPSLPPPRSKPEKTTDDYMFQFYLGSMTVVGLFILFRMVQKSK